MSVLGGSDLTADLRLYRRRAVEVAREVSPLQRLSATLNMLSLLLPPQDTIQKDEASIPARRKQIWECCAGYR